MIPPDIMEGIATGQIPPPMVEQLIMELMNQQGGGQQMGAPPMGGPPMGEPPMPMM